MCKGIEFEKVQDFHILDLEVIHDKIPNGSMTSHEFNDLFCSFGYLRIK
jgi:hypothetical protein